MSWRITKMAKRLIVETSDESGYCHNPKCDFLNVSVGCSGYEEGDKPNCVVCGKPCYTTTDGTGRLGDTSKVDI